MDHSPMTPGPHTPLQHRATCCFPPHLRVVQPSGRSDGQTDGHSPSCLLPDTAAQASCVGRGDTLRTPSRLPKDTLSIRTPKNLLKKCIVMQMPAHLVITETPRSTSIAYSDTLPGMSSQKAAKWPPQHAARSKCSSKRVATARES